MTVGVSLPRGCLNKDQETGCKHPPVEKTGIRVTPWKTSPVRHSRSTRRCRRQCPLTYRRKKINWVASNLSGIAGALGAEAIGLRNYFICFVCVLEKFLVIVTEDECVVNSLPPPWAVYCDLMACRFVALDMHPRGIPAGIGGSLRQSIAKLVMRVAGDKAKTACGILQLCASSEAVIEGATHTMAQRRQEWTAPAPEGIVEEKV